MLINRKELEQIALLAKLKIDKQEEEALIKSFTSIVDMIDHINEAQTDGIQPMSNPMDAVQRLRSDEITEPSQKATLLGLANHADDDFYLVPKVID